MWIYWGKILIGMGHNMQKNIRIITVGIVLVSVSLFGAYWVQQYLQRSRASATPPTTSFLVAGPKVNPGDSFDLTMQINPNLTPFFSFDVAFTYDPTKVSLKVQDPATILSNITPLSTKDDGMVDVQLLTGPERTSINTETHTIRLTGLRVNGQNDPFIGRDPLKMVKISFVMNQGQSLPLEFKWVDPDPAKVNASDSYEKKNLTYTGEEPTTPPTQPTTPPNLGSNSATGGSGSNTVTPIPFPTSPAGGVNVATTTTINERKDLLYINSIVMYQAPFRYEQNMKLERGSYTLTVGAKVYVKMGSGMVIGLICNEDTCGSKKRGQFMYTSPQFPLKAEFSEMKQTVTIPDDADSKEYTLRIFCEDGSECEIDYISLEDAWGSERVKNTQFDGSQEINDPRRQPADWEIDATANMYGSIDPAFGKDGALMINNPAK